MPSFTLSGIQSSYIAPFLNLISTTLAIYILLTLTVIFLTLLLHLQFSRSTTQVDRDPLEKKPPLIVSSEAIYITDLNATHAVLVNDDPATRAIPNIRLNLAFGIDNAFTTALPASRLSFRKRVEKMLSLRSSDWVNQTRYIRETVNEQLGGERILLQRLVHKTTLVTVLGVLYPDKEIPKSSWTPEFNSDLQFLADGITRAWVESKDGVFEEWRKRSLIDLMEGIVPGCTAKENPLNYLLPAYETLWRVVLLGVLEIGFKQHGKPGLKQTLIRYLQNPSTLGFSGTSKFVADEIFPGHIVSELLRVYPPTKRIYRAIEGQLYAVDIEEIHRTEEIWGNDSYSPFQFAPERWKNPTREMHSAFMSFGKHAFACPARVVFAPRMISLLIAGILEGIEKVGYDISERPWDENELLVNSRTGYADLELVRR